MLIPLIVTEKSQSITKFKQDTCPFLLTSAAFEPIDIPLLESGETVFGTEFGMRRCMLRGRSSAVLFSISIPKNNILETKVHYALTGPSMPGSSANAAVKKETRVTVRRIHVKKMDSQLQSNEGIIVSARREAC